VRLPIYLGASRANMNKGAVHLTHTSLPIGGENTNCVIGAHRGMGTRAMFRDIEDLQPGDEIYITNYRETLTYRAVEIKIALPTELAPLLILPGRDMVTFTTCHPYRHNSHRYLVYFERVA